MPSTIGRSSQRGSGVGRVAAATVGFVLLGIPIVGYLWDVLSDILAGTIHAARLLIAVLLLLVLAGLLRLLAGTIRRLEAERQTAASPVSTE